MLWPRLDTSTESLNWMRGQAFAHRGLSVPGQIPENSLAAFEHAIEAGCGIELDVQITRDTDLVVFNDDTLDRMTDHKGPVRNYNRNELRQMNLEGTDQKIMVLSDVLDAIAGRAPVLIEIRSEPSVGRQDFICFALRRALEGYRAPHAIMSFNWHIVGWFSRHHAKIQRGLLVHEPPATRTWSKFNLRRRFKRQMEIWRSKPHFLAQDVTQLPTHMCTQARKTGRPILAWPVNDEATLTRAEKYADCILFDGAPPTHHAPQETS